MQSDRKYRILVWSLFAVAAVGFLSAGVLHGARAAAAQKLSAAGWGETAPHMVRRTAGALVHMGVVSALAAGALFAGLRTSFVRAHPGLFRWLLGGALAVDLALVARRYVETYDAEAIYRSNALIDRLKSDPEPFRLKLLSRGGLYDYWAATLFPCYDIPMLDIVAASRLPADEMRFMTAFERDPVRFWQISNVRYLLGDTRALQPLLRSEGVNSPFERAMSFNVARDGDSLVVVLAQPGQAAQHTLVRFKSALPRVALFRHWEAIESSSNALSRLTQPDFNPLTTLLVERGDGTAAPPAPSGGPALLLPVALRSYARRDLRAEVPAQDQPCMLLVGDKYDARWRAWVDGRPAPVYRANGIGRAVPVPAGARVVSMSFRPSMGAIGLSMAVTLGVLGWGAVALAGGAMRGRRGGG
jgi:hypothetical protein